MKRTLVKIKGHVDTYELKTFEEPINVEEDLLKLIIPLLEKLGIPHDKYFKVEFPQEDGTIEENKEIHLFDINELQFYYRDNQDKKNWHKSGLTLGMFMTKYARVKEVE